ncbi:hypothetical protein GS943_11780 [Rhodococcus hoagii]|nr:hypothetical protein [Prescottella equi]
MGARQGRDLRSRQELRTLLELREFTSHALQTSFPVGHVGPDARPLVLGRRQRLVCGLRFGPGRGRRELRALALRRALGLTPALALALALALAVAGMRLGPVLDGLEPGRAEAAVGGCAQQSTSTYGVGEFAVGHRRVQGLRNLPQRRFVQRSAVLAHELLRPRRERTHQPLPLLGEPAQGLGIESALRPLECVAQREDGVDLVRQFTRQEVDSPPTTVGFFRRAIAVAASRSFDAFASATRVVRAATKPEGSSAYSSSATWSTFVIGRS